MKSQHRILLVDDNPLIVEMMARQIRALPFDCECDTETDACVALERHFQTPYSLILTDCYMPQMNGYEFCETIRKWEETTSPCDKTRIVAMSGDHEAEAYCKSAGMNEFIVKPLSLETLRDLIQNKAPRNRKNIFNRQPLIDLIGDNESLIAEYQQAFMRQALNSLDALASKLDHHDFSGVKETAHFLKTSARVVGADYILECLDKLENAALSYSLAACRGCMEKLSHAVRELAEVEQHG